MAGVIGAVVARDADEPTHSPRQLYNIGTRLMKQGKLSKAETTLQDAVARNYAPVQPPALYNLGEIRFHQGQADLKRAPNETATESLSATAGAHADAAIRNAQSALAGNDMTDLVEAYLQGWGARRQVKLATEAIQEALKRYGIVLSRWQRASGDFASAAELRPGFTNATFNAQVVNRHIAELVDRRHTIGQPMAGLSNQHRRLNQLLKALRSRIPADLLPKGMGDDGDEDNDADSVERRLERQHKAGSKLDEARPRPNRDGNDSALTAEEAMRLLESLKLDTNRKLPLSGPPRRPTRAQLQRNW